MSTTFLIPSLGPFPHCQLLIHASCQQETLRTNLNSSLWWMDVVGNLPIWSAAMTLIHYSSPYHNNHTRLQFFGGGGGPM